MKKIEKTKVEFSFSKQDINDILMEWLISNEHIDKDSKISMEEIKKYIDLGGGNPHDSYGEEIFDGIKIILNK
jgi:hypothetical protein